VAKRILHVLEATVGGTREHLMQIAQGLDPQAFELSFAVSNLRDPRVDRDIERLRQAGHAVYVVPMQRAIAPLSDLANLWRLWRLMRLERFDIVHTHSSKAGILGRLAAKLAGVGKIIHTGHTFAFQWNSGLKGWIYTRIERLAARWCHCIVAVSHKQKDLAQAKLRCEGKLVVIENGVDAGRFRRAGDPRAQRARLGLPTDGLLVGMVARLVRQKGCEHFVDAASIVLRTHRDVHFVLIGGGELDEKIRCQIKSLGIADNVTMLGHRDDTDKIYPVLDVFVLSSLWEGHPYALLEAMAAGRPVVASRIPGIEEVVQEGVTGFLVDIEDAQDIARKLVALLDNPALRDAMGRRGGELVRGRYSHSAFIQRLSELYES